MQVMCVYWPNGWCVRVLTQTGDKSVYWPKQVLCLCIDPNGWCVWVSWPDTNDMSVYLDLIQILFMFWPKQVICLCIDPNRWCVCVLTKTGDVSVYWPAHMICLCILTPFRWCVCYIYTCYCWYFIWNCAHMSLLINKLLTYFLYRTFCLIEVNRAWNGSDRQTRSKTTAEVFK